MLTGKGSKVFHGDDKSWNCPTISRVRAQHNPIPLEPLPIPGYCQHVANENQTDPQSPNPGMRETFGLDQYEFTRGKWIVIGLSVALMAVGVILSATSKEETQLAKATSVSHNPGGNSGTSSGSDGMMTTFGDGGGISLPIPGLTNVFPEIPEPASAPTTEETDQSIGTRDLSKTMVKGGFGMFMGFAIGFAIRAFVKLATVIIGFYFLTLTMLAYMGWIEIHWHIIEGQTNGLITNLGAQFESFKTFLTGSIPSGGASAAGLAMGLRKK